MCSAVCRACPVGKYQSNLNATACHTCPFNSVAVTPGSLSCYFCGPGLFATDAGCVICGRDAIFSPETQSCLPCPLFSAPVPPYPTRCWCFPGFFDSSNGTGPLPTCAPCPIAPGHCYRQTQQAVDSLVSNTYRIAAYCVSALGITLSFAFAAVFVWFRQRAVIQATTPSLVYLVFLGTAGLYCSIILFALPVTRTMCYFRWFLPSLSLALVLSSILAKNLRIYAVCFLLLCICVEFGADYGCKFNRESLHEHAAAVDCGRVVCVRHCSHLARRCAGLLFCVFAACRISECICDCVIVCRLTLLMLNGVSFPTPNLTQSQSMLRSAALPTTISLTLSLLEWLSLWLPALSLATDYAMWYVCVSVLFL